MSVLVFCSWVSSTKRYKERKPHLLRKPTSCCKAMASEFLKTGGHSIEITKLWQISIPGLVPHLLHFEQLLVPPPHTGTMLRTANSHWLLRAELAITCHSVFQTVTSSCESHLQHWRMSICPLYSISTQKRLFTYILSTPACICKNQIPQQQPASRSPSTSNLHTHTLAETTAKTEKSLNGYPWIYAVSILHQQYCADHHYDYPLLMQFV